MPSHVLRDQGPPSTLDSTSAPIPVTVTHFVPPKVTVTVQLDPAASTLYISWLDLSTAWEAAEKERTSVYSRESGRNEGDV